MHRASSERRWQDGEIELERARAMQSAIDQKAVEVAKYEAIADQSISSAVWSSWLYNFGGIVGTVLAILGFSGWLSTEKRKHVPFKANAK
jgi:hypothetical protein